MKKQLIIILILIIAQFMIPAIPIVEASSTPTTVQIVVDKNGYARNASGVYTNQSNATVVRNQVNAAPFIDRGWLRFNLSTLPDGALVTEAYLQYEGGHNVQIRIMNMTLDPTVYRGAEDRWNAAGNGTVLYDAAGFIVFGPSQNISLGTTAVAAINKKISSDADWFALGTRFQNEGAPGVIADIESFDSPGANPQPTLELKYYVNPFIHYFSDTYYENGTLYVPPVNVSYTGDGFSGEFNTSGGAVQYFENETEAFSWDIGGGDTRRIYSFGSENFTVTYPDGTDYVYAFTIKDYTAKTPLFLEAYRTINGTETLITREEIKQPNAIGLNLVFGKTYRLKVLFSDGTRYDWGYFIPGTDTTITINLRSVTFTDSMQLLFNTIQVEATRSTDGATLTVDYNDTRENTIWANVTISLRGGGVVFTASRDNDTYTLNWASANASLGYIVTVSGDHDDYGTWGYVKIFDVDPTFPAAPSLTGIFEFGLGADFGAWIITVGAIIGFSKAMQGRALIVGALVATLLAYIGWASWDYYQLIFYWVFAILANIAIGRIE